MKVIGRGRIVAVVTGSIVLVLSILVTMERDRIIEWYQVRRLVGTWVDREIEILVDRESFAFYVPILSPEITVTHDRHMVMTSPLRGDPETWRIPFSVEGDKLKLQIDEEGDTKAFEFSFGFSDSGDLFLDDDMARSTYHRRE